LLSSTQNELCLTFNLRGNACRSSHSASTFHICSLCGSSNHGATS
jgi:hypothetical protein